MLFCPLAALSGFVCELLHTDESLKLQSSQEAILYSHFYAVTAHFVFINIPSLSTSSCGALIKCSKASPVNSLWWMKHALKDFVSSDLEILVKFAHDDYVAFLVILGINC